ncbi:MAG: FmdB family zinc ribbon protein [Sciscionella sp.]
MPTYQYACKACDHRFEAVQSFTDSALTECPECSGTLRKLYGSVGVVFKGSGFYRNDSRAATGAKASSGAGSSSDKGDGKSDGKGDGKGKSDTSGTSASSTSTDSSSSSTSSSSSSGSSSSNSSTSTAKVAP